MTADERKIRIRDLNDELRLNGPMVAMGTLGQEDEEKIIRVYRAAAAFEDWSEGDDPYGEAFIFKIDYYSLDEAHGSEHPEDQNTTIRVMTLMSAEDY